MLLSLWQVMDILNCEGVDMEASFWHQKWEKGDIGFHRSEANAFLIEHFEKLNLAKGARVFLPLCGKTRDFAWLLTCGIE
jgi:thiopurine S-methyltransferase